MMHRAAQLEHGGAASCGPPSRVALCRSYSPMAMGITFRPPSEFSVTILFASTIMLLLLLMLYLAMKYSCNNAAACTSAKIADYWSLRPITIDYSMHCVSLTCSAGCLMLCSSSLLSTAAVVGVEPLTPLTAASLHLSAQLGCECFEFQAPFAYNIVSRAM